MSEIVWSVHWKKSGKIVRGSHGKKYYETESGATKRCQQGYGLMEVRKMVVMSNTRETELVNTERWMSCLEAAGIDNAEAYDYAYELKSEDPESYGELNEDGEVIEDE